MLYEHGLPGETVIRDLTPASQPKASLTPATSVVVVNRGAEPLVRLFDSIEYPIPPGYSRMPYGAALHFQRHTVVPGTRDVETGAEQSYLGIVGVDAAELCQPFTLDQCATFGQRVEAVAREADEVHVESVGAQIVAGKVPARGGGGKSKRVAFAREGVTASGARIPREDVLRPDDGLNDAQREIAEAAAEAASGQ